MRARVRDCCEERVERHWKFTVNHFTNRNFRHPIQRIRSHLRGALHADMREHVRRDPQASKGDYRGWTN